MASVFMPSCNNSLLYARSMAKLERYLFDRGFAESATGCCKPGGPGHEQLREGDRVLVVCNTCSAIARESMGCEVANVFELIAGDPSFRYPDYGGEEIAVQDCWRAHGNHSLHEAVRKLLGNMNLKPVELAQSRDESRFCGVSTLKELSPLVAELAPRCFSNLDEGMFTPCCEEERRKLMEQHAAEIPTQRVACYCFSCDQGLALGGADSAALINLLFDRQ